MFSCTCKSSVQPNCPYIEVYYMEKGYETLNSISSPVLFKEMKNVYADTLILDDKVVRTFIKYIDSLENDSVCKNIDIRVMSIVHLNDSTQSVVCLGEKWGTMVDNIMKHDNQGLFDFVNKILYDEIGWKHLFMKVYGNNYDVNSLDARSEWELFIKRVRDYGEIYEGF